MTLRQLRVMSGLIVLTLSVSGCVSRSKLVQLQRNSETMIQNHEQVVKDIKAVIHGYEDDIATLHNVIQQLNERIHEFDQYKARVEEFKSHPHTCKHKHLLP